MLDKRIKHFWKCVRVSRESHDASRPRRAGISSVAQPFDSLFSQVFDEHPTVATPKERKFCAATSQNHSVSSLGSLLKSTSTARWVTSAHGRALTIIAESQHPATPCGHRCLRTHVSRRSQTHVHTISSGLRAIDTHEQSRLTSDSLSN